MLARRTLETAGDFKIWVAQSLELATRLGGYPPSLSCMVIHLESEEVEGKKSNTKSTVHSLAVVATCRKITYKSV